MRGRGLWNKACDLPVPVWHKRRHTCSQLGDFVQGAFDPRMMDALQGEAGGQAFEQSLKEMNMTPEEVMKKIMSDPELAVVSLQTCVSINSSHAADAQCEHICCVIIQQYSLHA